MNNGLKVHRILDLVKGDLFGANVLCMLNTTIHKRIVRNLELAKDFLQFRKNRTNYVTVAGDLEVIDMLGHQSNKFTAIMSKAKLRVNRTRN